MTFLVPYLKSCHRLVYLCRWHSYIDTYFCHGWLLFVGATAKCKNPATLSVAPVIAVKHFWVLRKPPIKWINEARILWAILVLCRFDLHELTKKGGKKNMKFIGTFSSATSGPSHQQRLNRRARNVWSFFIQFWRLNVLNVLNVKRFRRQVNGNDFSLEPSPIKCKRVCLSYCKSLEFLTYAC